MNSRDLCMIDHLPELMAAGVDSFKIEGRAKSAYYAAIVTGAYRHCIDAAVRGEAPDPVWRDEVEHVSHRHYSTGFFFGQPGQYTESARYIRTWQVCAIVLSCDETGWAKLSRANLPKGMRWRSSARICGLSHNRPLMEDEDELP
ncbi:MAG: peptidase U32 family protein [Ruthenibacterium lactatiformans]|uniref:peptidase U32 family protein n=1 Tax=Ruthenibacterium lactatiformans TaxID=1550024 RepID=UPI003994B881